MFTCTKEDALEKIKKLVEKFNDHFESYKNIWLKCL